MRERQKKLETIKPEQELYRHYLQTVLQATDEYNQRKARENILHGILATLFAEGFTQLKPHPSAPPNRLASGPAETSLTNVSATKSSYTKNSLGALAQLWASFEAGDTKAAVDLADIYLRGDGVPVNCEQARVILFVASKENNAEATKRLQDLESAGCPAP